MVFLIHVVKMSSSNTKTLISHKNRTMLLCTKFQGVVTGTRLHLTTHAENRAYEMQVWLNALLQTNYMPINAQLM